MFDLRPERSSVRGAPATHLCAVGTSHACHASCLSIVYFCMHALYCIQYLCTSALACRSGGAITPQEPFTPRREQFLQTVADAAASALHIQRPIDIAHDISHALFECLASFQPRLLWLPLRLPGRERIQEVTVSCGRMSAMFGGWLEASSPAKERRPARPRAALNLVVIWPPGV